MKAFFSSDSESRYEYSFWEKILVKPVFLKSLTNVNQADFFALLLKPERGSVSQRSLSPNTLNLACLFNSLLLYMNNLFHPQVVNITCPA